MPRIPREPNKNQGSSGDVNPLAETHPPADADAPMQEVVYLNSSNNIEHNADESSGVADISLDAIIQNIVANPTRVTDAPMDENELEDPADPKVAEEKEMAMAESSSKRNPPAAKVSNLDAIIDNMKTNATRAADVLMVQHGLKDQDDPEVIILSDDDDEVHQPSDSPGDEKEMTMAEDSDQAAPPPFIVEIEADELDPIMPQVEDAGIDENDQAPPPAVYFVDEPPEEESEGLFTEAEARRAFEIVSDKDYELRFAAIRWRNVADELRLQMQNFSDRVTYDHFGRVDCFSQACYPFYQELQFRHQGAEREYERVVSTRRIKREQFLSRCLIGDYYRETLIALDTFPATFAYFKDAYDVRFAVEQSVDDHIEANPICEAGAPMDAYGLEDGDNQEVIMLSDEDDEIGQKEDKEIDGKVDDDIENANAQDTGVVQISDAVTEERVAMAENSSEQNSPLLNVAKIDAIHCHNEMNDTRAADMPMVQNRLEDGDDQEVIMLSDDEVEHGHKANEELGGKVDDAIKEANEQDNGLEPNALALIEEENAAERSPAHNLPRAKVAEIDTYELDPSNAAGLGEEMAMDEGSPEQNLPQGEVAGFDENVPVPPQEVAFVAAPPEVVAPPPVDIVAPPEEVAIDDAPPEFVVVAAPPQVRTPPRVAPLPRLIYTEAEAKEAFDVLREEDSPLSLAEHRNGNIIIETKQEIQNIISHRTTYDASRNVLLASQETLQRIHELQVRLQEARQEYYRVTATKCMIRESFVSRCLIRESCRVSFTGFDKFPISFADFKERYSVRFAEDQNENRGNVEEANAEYNGYAPFQGHGAEH